MYVDPDVIDGPAVYAPASRRTTKLPSLLLEIRSGTHWMPNPESDAWVGDRMTEKLDGHGNIPTIGCALRYAVFNPAGIQHY
jgi:hypothetical protein